MCGIVGVLNLTDKEPIREEAVGQMLAMIRHRGPDGFGIYLGDQIGLGNARLSIIDLFGGDQPISNEDKTYWIVFNGEIFNYLELRQLLERRGHCFSTQSDTEVILHLYEEYGPECLQYLNGQFAIAIWNSLDRTLFLARDRLGIRPLFYTLHAGKLIFGSEIKSVLAFPGVKAQIDPLALDQIFTYWSTLSPRSVLEGIFDIPPGHFLLARDGDFTLNAYWALDFRQDSASSHPIDVYIEELESLLLNATRIRLRADVSVGAYLSGGLDSSTIAAMIRSIDSSPLDTFSIVFSDPEFDESPFQQQMAHLLGTRHQVVYAEPEEIGRVFPDVIWHSETPVLRTAPAPMFLLSGLVEENGYKVVLTGEGADEFLAGYDIFKEAKVRRFWARQSDSISRPLLLQRLYSDISSLPANPTYLAAFFGAGLKDTEAFEYSHAIRWKITQRTRRFFSKQLREELEKKEFDPYASIVYPPDFAGWDSLARAQWLEGSVFLPQYLLSSQGDRMAMAHSIETRFPFLDFRVVEFCNRLPSHLKLFSLTDKYILRKLACNWLPDDIRHRPKKPYRAPIQSSFFNKKSSDYVREILSPEMINATGLFNNMAVKQMQEKIDSGMQLSETDNMALVGILSTQLVYQQFVSDFKMPSPLSYADKLKVYVKQN